MFEDILFLMIVWKLIKELSVMEDFGNFENDGGQQTDWP